MEYKLIWESERDGLGKRYNHNYIWKAELEVDTGHIRLSTIDGDKVFVHKDEIADAFVYILEGIGWKGCGQISKSDDDAKKGDMKDIIAARGIYDWKPGDKRAEETIREIRDKDE